MQKSLLKNHWFWKHLLKKDRLLNTDNEEINTKILHAQTVFYILLFVKLSFMMFSFNDYVNLEIIDPLWSVFWVKFLPNFPWIPFFLIVCFVFSAGMVVFKATRYLKITMFVICFVFFSLLNSRGKINHSLHTVLIPLFCFIFLKDLEKKNYQNFIIFSTAVFALLMSYFLAGFWKILKAFHHYFKGEKGIFDQDAFTRMLQYQYRYEEPSIFASWIMEHDTIGFVMIWSGILLELFSLVAFFFGKIHKIWGLALLLLHISIAIIMNVSFANAFMTLIPLLILSPFAGNKKVI